MKKDLHNLKYPGSRRGSLFSEPQNNFPVFAYTPLQERENLQILSLSVVKTVIKAVKEDGKRTKPTNFRETPKNYLHFHAK